MDNKIRILGIDPSLVKCGWGVIEVQGLKLRHIESGTIRIASKAGMPARLGELFQSLLDIISTHKPDEAAIEDIFLNSNPASTAKLGYARAICMLAPTRSGLDVAEYSARKVKKSVVGTGTADKAQVAAMMNVLLPGYGFKAGDRADALAIAICHAHRINAGGNLYRRSA